MKTIPTQDLFARGKHLLSLLLITSLPGAGFTQANTALSNLVSPTAIEVNLLPGTNNAKDLGSSAHSWKNVYVRGFIYTGGIRTIKRKGTNNFFGSSSGNELTTGTDNTSVGHASLFNTTAGRLNTASGTFSLFNNTSGNSNTAFGSQTLFGNTTGEANTAVGILALYSNTTGFNNMAAGNRALFSNVTGCCNIAAGSDALAQNVAGEANVALGHSALFRNTGNFNTAVGYAAGETFSNISTTTLLGAYSYAADDIINAVAIGYGASVYASNSVVVGNNTTSSIGGQVNWSKLSDSRFKKNIKEDVPGLSFISQLRPVTYSLDIEALDNRQLTSLPDNTPKRPGIPAAAPEQMAGIRHTGFIAQDVEEVAKKLNYDFSGIDKPAGDKGFYALRYAEFVVPLVKAVQELSKKNEDLQHQIDELRSLIQKQNGHAEAYATGNGYVKQNIPNPANNSTSISYFLPDDHGKGQIIITDKKGSTVKAYSVPGGRGQITIKSGELPSGAYQYSLYSNGKHIDSRQMMITK